MATGTGEFQAVAAVQPGAKQARTTTHFTRWLPYRDAGHDNPVFTFVARVHRRHDMLRERTARWIQQPVVLMFGLWVAVAVIILLTDRDLSLYQAISNLLGTLLLLSLADKLVLDFAAASAALDVVPSDVENGRWDLIAVSNISTDRYITAYHVLAQLRSWRLMCRVIGLRLGIVITLVLHSWFLPLLIPDERYGLPNYRSGASSPLESVAQSLAQDPVNVFYLVPAALALLIVAALYVIEPRWRLRALAAASVAISAQQRQSPLHLVAAVGAMLRVWFAQILTGVMAFALLWLFGVIFGPVAYSESAQFAGMWLFLAYLLIVWWVIRYAYQSLSRRWQTSAWKRMIRLGGEA